MKGARATSMPRNWPKHLEASPSRKAETEEFSFDPMLEPYHKIFLSHSGAQKTFVQQLCDDLVAETYTPFFDQRDDSLPKGEKYAHLIFEAARQCHVAVVVLSEDYLTSRWPMLELVEFVKAQRSGNSRLKLLPLLYKVSSEDVSNQSNFKRWKGRWKLLAKKDGRIVLSECIDAVQELRRVNGVNFHRGTSEKSYRKTVVEKIWLLSPPDLPHDLDDKEGCGRICEVLSGMFVADDSVDKLGVHGMGGLGKTNICKALCNYFHNTFYGRVFHLELGSKREPLDLQKRMLQTLFRLGDKVLQTISSFEQVVSCLKKHVKLQPVLLLIDNVYDEEESREEAAAYLKAKFHPGSKIVVTSRSQAVLKTLLRNSKFCKPMPNLKKDEAANIFLRRAAGPEKMLFSLEGGEKRILETCLEQCYFSLRGDDPSSSNRRNCSTGQYHPLALIALAAYFASLPVQDSSDLLSWEPYLQDFDKLKHSKESERLFGILGMQLRTWSKSKKRIFLDVALFSRGRVELYLTSYHEWVDWLALVNHDQTPRAVEIELAHLKDVGIVDWGNLTVTTHELYKEYAEWSLTWGCDEEELWCAHQKPPYDSLPRALDRTAPPGCWPDLARIQLEGLTSPPRFPSGKEQEWRNVIVLQLHSCPNFTALNLQDFSCLRHLELINLANLETLTFHNHTATTSTSWYTRLATWCTNREEESAVERTPQQLGVLQIVMLDNLPALKQLSSFTPCVSLKTFIMQRCPSLTEPPIFQQCARLETLQMSWHPRQAHKPIDLSTLSGLRELSIEGLQSTWTSAWGRVLHVQLEGLSSLTQLETRLYFLHVPVRSLPGLERITKLRLLSLEHCVTLQELTGLDYLAHLEVLNVSYTEVKELSGLDRLFKLRVFECAWCQELLWLPDLHELPNLRYLNTLGCTKLTKYPRLPSYSFIHSRSDVQALKRKESDGPCKACNESPCQCDDPYRFLDSEGEDFIGMFG